MKLLSLNIQRGKYISTVIEFIKREQFDAMCFQEVAGGTFGYKGIDCFEILRQALPLYRTEMETMISLAADPEAYFANAVFIRSMLSLVARETIWLKEKQIITSTPSNFSESPRCVLVVAAQMGDRIIKIMSGHLAWSPTPDDTPEKLRQGEILLSWFERHKGEPFLFGADFNVDPSSIIVSKLSQYGRNLTVEFGITNTLHPKLHRAQNIFPRGLAVDFIFSSPDIDVTKFYPTVEDLSDHIGLVGEFVL